LLLLTLSSCYITKPLKESKALYFDNKFETKIYNHFGSKYINENDSNNYSNAFINGINSESQYYNILITNNKNDNYDFVLKITKLEPSESTSSETINDEKSQYNGKSFEKSNCSVNAKYILYNKEQNIIVSEGEIYVNKEEKISNNRNFGDYVFGTNKDNSEYRYKELSDGIISELCEKCGKHLVVKITKKIRKNIK